MSDIFLVREPLAGFDVVGEVTAFADGPFFPITLLLFIGGVFVLGFLTGKHEGTYEGI